ncbi:MAG: sensor histidine kinase [Deferrisomatales bacterium]
MAEGVAHEVRNPMVSIGGFARRIRDRLGEADPLREYAEHIIKEVERLETMVEEIVRFKALMISPYEPVDLREVADEVLAERARALEEGDLGARRRYDPQLPVIQGDRGHLKTALGNVVENAIEATPPGGTVTITLSAEDGRVRVEVEDTGRGIGRAELSNVFDPFYTSKMTGAGMGLTMVHRIVTRHGGEVELASEPGHGTRVTLHLPVEQTRPI